MSTLDHRVAKLEAELLKVRFDAMSDDELRAYAATFPFKSPKQYEAIIALINRHGSAFPIVHDDPDWVTPARTPESVSNMKDAQNGSNT